MNHFNDFKIRYSEMIEGLCYGVFGFYWEFYFKCKHFIVILHSDRETDFYAYEAEAVNLVGSPTQIFG